MSEQIKSLLTHILRAERDALRAEMEEQGSLLNDMRAQVMMLEEGNVRVMRERDALREEVDKLERRELSMLIERDDLIDSLAQIRDMMPGQDHGDLIFTDALSNPSAVPELVEDRFETMEGKLAALAGACEKWREALSGYFGSTDRDNPEWSYNNFKNRKTILRNAESELMLELAAVRAAREV